MCWAMSKVVSFGCHVIENPIFDGQNMLKKRWFLGDFPQNSYPLCEKNGVDGSLFRILKHGMIWMMNPVEQHRAT